VPGVELIVMEGKAHVSVPPVAVGEGGVVLPVTVAVALLVQPLLALVTVTT
jgi:hypothetical protein